MAITKTLFCVIVVILCTCNCLAQFSPFGTRKNLTAYPDALCLDGTHGAYYYRLNSSSQNWFIFHEGGGWSYNLEDVEKRSWSEFGSANFFPHQIYLSGSLDGNKTRNPLFYDWNVIYIKYCDGSSYSSYREKPILYDSSLYYFRGKAILEAVLVDITSNFPISQAKNIVITGCSAGGLAVYLHVDWWRENLPQTAKVVGMPDAGWFYNSANIDGYHIYAESMRSGFEMWNASAGVNARCISYYSSPADAWQCVLAQYAYPFIETPLFVLNARYDAWSALNILQLLCVVYQEPIKTWSCSQSELAQYEGWGAAAAGTMQSILKTQPSGLFEDACNYHCQTQDDTWSITQVNNKTIMAAFAQWLNGGNGVFVDGPTYGVNPTCPENVFSI